MEGGDPSRNKTLPQKTHKSLETAGVSLNRDEVVTLQYHLLCG